MVQSIGNNITVEFSHKTVNNQNKKPELNEAILYKYDNFVFNFTKHHAAYYYTN